jgi:hypothetical protein
MLYQAYLDDSADRNRERVVVGGAIVGNCTEWNKLTGNWNARLKMDDIKYFKSSHCETLNGQFHKFRKYGFEEGKRHALQVRDDLYNILTNSPMMMLGVTLSIPFHKTMLADSAKFGRVPEIPYQLSFQQVLAECGKAMLLLGRNHIVTFGHDDGDDFDELRSIYRDFKKLNPRYAKRMADFVPLDDKLHPPVQAADIAAWMTYQFANDFVVSGALVSSDNIIHRVPDHMYKIVNWLDNPRPYSPDISSEQAPAKAVYVS